MEDQERVIEILLGLVFIAILLLGVFIVLNYDGSSSKNPKPNTILNTYNTNNYYVSDQIKEKSSSSNNRDISYFEDLNYYEKNTDYVSLRYSSYANHVKKKDFVGSYVDEFTVYVTNKDTKSGYFKVKFHFEDSDGKEWTETVTKYVGAHDTETIKFTDIQFEKYKYGDWDYEVIPDTKISSHTSTHYYYDSRDYSGYYGKKGFDYVYY